MNFLRTFSQYPPSSRQVSPLASGASRKVLSVCAKRPFTWVRVVTAAADPPASLPKKPRRDTEEFMAGLLLEGQLGGGLYCNAGKQIPLRRKDTKKPQES